MKKTTAMILCAAVVAAMFTGCKKNADSVPESVPESAPTQTSSAPESESAAESSADSAVSSDTNSSVGDVSDSVSDGTDIDNPEDGGDSFVEPVDANAKLDYPDTKAGELMKTALSTDNWGFMSLTSEQEIIDVLIGTDLKVDDTEDILVAYTDNSAQLFTVIIAKPKADKADVVTSSLKAYIEKVQNDENLSFYPMQQESADGAVFAELADGYLAVVVNADGQTIADSLKE